MSELEEYQDIFEDDPEEKVEVVVEEQVEEPVEEPEKVEEPPKEPTTDSKEESWTLSAVMDEREKRQKAVKEAEELREKLKAYERPEDDISVFEDEQKYKSQQEQKIQQALRNTELNMSQAFAETVFGEDKVSAAIEWFKSEGVQSPTALKRFNGAKLPFHELIKMHDDDAIYRDPEGYKAKLRAEIEAEFSAKTTKKSVTPSLASSRSVGDSKPSTDDFEDILKD